MSEEKLRIIRNSADRYKKFPKDKWMFALGFMQSARRVWTEKNSGSK